MYKHPLIIFLFFFNFLLFSQKDSLKREFTALRGQYSYEMSPNELNHVIEVGFSKGWFRNHGGKAGVLGYNDVFCQLGYHQYGANGLVHLRGGIEFATWIPIIRFSVDMNTDFKNYNLDFVPEISLGYAGLVQFTVGMRLPLINETSLRYKSWRFGISSTVPFLNKSSFRYLKNSKNSKLLL